MILKFNKLTATKRNGINQRNTFHGPCKKLWASPQMIITMKSTSTLPEINNPMFTCKSCEMQTERLSNQLKFQFLKKQFFKENDFEGNHRQLAAKFFLVQGTIVLWAAGSASNKIEPDSTIGSSTSARCNRHPALESFDSAVTLIETRRNGGACLQLEISAGVFNEFQLFVYQSIALKMLFSKSFGSKLIRVIF